MVNVAAIELSVPPQVVWTMIVEQTIEVVDMRGKTFVYLDSLQPQFVKDRTMKIATGAV